ncbi:MAG: serine/threonine protein kinase [Polaromonas sp.]|nr:serine/threonine protein kinase [Polaromonas sp.]
MQKTDKRGFSSWLRSDAATALLMVFAVIVAEASTGLVEALENRFFDKASQMTGRLPSEQVVVLAIDDQSIANIGRWPWPRDVHAKVIDQLSAGQAKTIAHTTLFFEPQVDRGLSHLLALKGLMAADVTSHPATSQWLGAVDVAIRDLDTDTTLAQSIQASGRVVLPMLFEPGQPLGVPDQALPEYVLRHALPAQSNMHFLQSVKASLPLAAFGQASAAVGHLNQAPSNTDGTLRSDPLFVDHDGAWIPSMALQVAAQSLNVSPTDIRSEVDGVFQMSGVRIPVDDQGHMYPQFYPDKNGRAPFVVDSFFDVYSGKIPASKYAGKIVIIGATAAGVGNRFVTPVSPDTPPAILLAHTTSSLLKSHFFSVPYWAPVVGLGMTLLVVLLVAGVLPRLTGGVAALLTGAVLVGLLTAELLLLTSLHVWVPLVLPAAALVVAYLGLTTKRFLFAEAGKIKSDEESAETNRMMGLAHQGQGQLDMAFDRFRRVPLSDALMDNLANLALDFERKRQFNKALAVYEHMAGFNKNYKDLAAKRKRAKNLSETVLLGGAGTHRGGTLLLEADQVEKPMLGRYQVEKELGKGAMGIVYLGKDPKIGRVVAIKTLALAQEFEGDELEDARQRFFREAETAGRLQHQNIVTIFDAGEDQELAYIAMEFLKGKDLVAYTQSGNLLPLDKVVDILIKVAQALDYAHGLNVVHRDIKPANIMYDPSTESVKVTDFGIARVTDASRTRTGMVLGTPSFMSPEQIAGKKVDGRSDLYSLGVMAFQLLTGTLPFRAESMAELMFKIANEAAPDIRAFNPAVPVPLAEVVARALVKNLDLRYASGRDMANDLMRSRMQLVPPSGAAPGALGSQGEAFVPGGNAADLGFEKTVVVPPPVDPLSSAGATSMSNRRGDA